MSDYKWISELKVGDKVIVDRSKYGHFDKTVETVEKINKSTIKACGNSFYKQNGRQRSGDCWHAHRIEQATESAIKSISEIVFERDLRNTLRNVDFRCKDYSVDQLKRIKAIIDEAHTNATESR